MVGATGVLIAGLIASHLRSTDYFWNDPVRNAVFQQVTDFDGIEQAAAVSRDGRFVAFLSDRDGRTDLWMTQPGTGRFYNLSRGRFQELVNPSVRTVTFSPDASQVMFWTREHDGGAAGEISTWELPTLGGEPRQFLKGVAEVDWSADGSRLVYHTPGPGDPMFVREPGNARTDRQIFAAASGLHAHYPQWSPSGDFIYFVQGAVPDAMDVWRIRPTGGVAERITFHHARVSHPVMLNSRTLMYLASDSEGGGPWLYSVDVNRRVPHRVSTGVDRYTSLAGSSDGRRLVATVAVRKETLWRALLSDGPVDQSTAHRISLTTGRASSPCVGPGYLLYVSSQDARDSIWRLSGGAANELWSAQGARIIGRPALSPDGTRVAFSIDQQGRTLLYVMNADGTDSRMVTDVLKLRGTPAWTPDGSALMSAANDGNRPSIFKITLDGRSASRLVREYSVDPVWSPDGRFMVYSGPDIGTTFPVKAVGAGGTPYALPQLMLSRGARHLRFLPGRRALLVLRGDIQHKNLWLIDLDTGSERQLTDFDRSFEIQDFDISPDGREIVLNRVQEESDIVLLERPRP